MFQITSRPLWSLAAGEVSLFATGSAPETGALSRYDAFWVVITITMGRISIELRDGKDGMKRDGGSEAR